MTKVLLSLHVLAAIVAIGPVTVAASMFPAALRRGDLAAMRVLNRICRVYALLGVAVPVFGLATAQSLGVLGDAWLLVSIALTVVAAAVLGFAVLPAQAAALVSAAVPSTLASVPDSSALASVPDSSALVSVPDSSALVSVPDSSDVAGSPTSPARRLGMTAGVFNLLWAVVVVLMIVRPGSTTGA